MTRWILLSAIVAACSSCERPPPEPQPTPDAGPPRYGDACDRLIGWGCKAGSPVCIEFNDVSGECAAETSCAVAWAADPQAYPDAACVLGLAPITADPCGEVERWCR